MCMYVCISLSLSLYIYICIYTYMYIYIHTQHLPTKIYPHYIMLCYTIISNMLYYIILCYDILYIPNIIPTKIRRLKQSGVFPMDMNNSTLIVKVLLEANPLKSRILGQRWRHSHTDQNT